MSAEQSCLNAFAAGLIAKVDKRYLFPPAPLSPSTIILLDAQALTSHAIHLLGPAAMLEYAGDYAALHQTIYSILGDITSCFHRVIIYAAPFPDPAANPEMLEQLSNLLSICTNEGKKVTKHASANLPVPIAFHAYVNGVLRAFQVPVMAPVGARIDVQMAADARRMAAESGGQCVVVTENPEMVFFHSCSVMSLKSFTKRGDLARGIVISRAAIAAELGITETQTLNLAVMLGNKLTAQFVVQRKTMCTALFPGGIIDWVIANGEEMPTIDSYPALNEAAERSRKIYNGDVDPVGLGSVCVNSAQAVVALLATAPGLPHVVTSVEEGLGLVRTVDEFAHEVASDGEPAVDKEASEWAREVAAFRLLTAVKQAENVTDKKCRDVGRFVQMYGANQWLLPLVTEVWDELFSEGKVSREAHAQGGMCIACNGQPTVDNTLVYEFSLDTYIGAVALQTVLNTIHRCIQTPHSPIYLFNSVTYFGLVQSPVPTKAPKRLVPKSTVESPKNTVGKLPVDEHYLKLMRHIEANRITIIHGETGCGKSSRIPAMIFEYTRGKAKMMVSQPRRIAARSLRERLQSTLDSPDRKQLVGLRLGGGVVEETRQTRIWFCTAGYLSRKISRDPQFFDSHTHLILDEVHERSVDMDVLCLYTKKLLESNKTIKILLMSATLQAHVFQEYFSVQAAPLFVGAKRFELTEIYADSKEFSLLTYNAPTIHPRACGLRQELASKHLNSSVTFGRAPITRHVVQMQHDLTISLCRALAQESLKKREEGSVGGGSILIFVSGMSDCFDLSYKFEQLYQIYNDPVWYKLTIIHSMVPIEEQMKAWDKAGPGEVKIVIATNSAESSLTLPDVDYVICLGTRKENRYNQQTRCSELVNTWISKASAVQRAGRTARTRPGKVFRIYSKALFNKMAEYDTPEILSTPLDKVILDLKYTTDKEVLPVLEELVEPPSKESARSALVSLYEHRMITSCSDKSQLTAIGKVAANLPIDLRIGHLVVLGSMLGCANTIIAVVAALNATRSPFRVATTLVHQDPDEYHAIIAQTLRTRDALDGGIFSEPLIIVKLISILAHSSTQFARNFCMDNGIVWARARQLFAAYTQLRRVVCEMAGLDRNDLLIASPEDVLADPAELNRVRLAMVLTNPRNLLVRKLDGAGVIPGFRVFDETRNAHHVSLKLLDGFSSLEQENVSSLFPPSVRWRPGDRAVSCWSGCLGERKIRELVKTAHRFVSKQHKITPWPLLAGTLGGSGFERRNHSGGVRKKGNTVDLLELAKTSGARRNQKGRNKHRKGKSGNSSRPLHTEEEEEQGVVSDESDSEEHEMFAAVLVETNANAYDFDCDYGYDPRYKDVEQNAVLYIHNQYKSVGRSVAERCMLDNAVVERSKGWTRYEAPFLKNVVTTAQLPHFLLINIDEVESEVTVESYNLGIDTAPITKWLYGKVRLDSSRFGLTTGFSTNPSYANTIHVFYTKEEDEVVAAKTGMINDLPYGVRLISAYASGNRPRDTVKLNKQIHQKGDKATKLKFTTPKGLSTTWKFVNDQEIASAHAKTKAELKSKKGRKGRKGKKGKKGNGEILPVQRFSDLPEPYTNDPVDSFAFGYDSDDSDELRQGGTNVFASSHTKASVLSHIPDGYDPDFEVYAVADSIMMIGQGGRLAKAENITLLPPSRAWLAAVRTCIPNTRTEDAKVVKMLSAQNISARQSDKLFVPNKALIKSIDAKFADTTKKSSSAPLPLEFIENPTPGKRQTPETEDAKGNATTNQSADANGDVDPEELTSAWYD